MNGCLCHCTYVHVNHGYWSTLGGGGRGAMRDPVLAADVDPVWMRYEAHLNAGVV